MSQKPSFETVEKLTDRLFAKAAQEETKITSMPIRAIRQLSDFLRVNRQP